MKTGDTGLSEAVRNGEWDKARHLAAIIVAEMMEQTESPREVKALSISLSDLIDKCEASDVTNEFDDSPIARIIAEHKRQELEWEARRSKQA